MTESGAKRLVTLLTLDEKRRLLEILKDLEQKRQLLQKITRKKIT